MSALEGGFEVLTQRVSVSVSQSPKVKIEHNAYVLGCTHWVSLCIFPFAFFCFSCSPFPKNQKSNQFRFLGDGLCVITGSSMLSTIFMMSQHEILEWVKEDPVCMLHLHFKFFGKRRLVNGDPVCEHLYPARHWFYSERWFYSGRGWPRPLQEELSRRRREGEVSLLGEMLPQRPRPPETVPAPEKR